MTAHTPSDAKAKAALIAAVESARRCNAQNSAQTLDLVKQLKELEVCIDHSNSVSQRPLCTLAGKIADHLVKNEPASRDDLLEWTRNLLAFVGQSIGVKADAEAAPSREGTNFLSATGIHSQLSLVDGQRLGEILVRMSYLESSEVARALELQRKNGGKLGAALVELDLLSQEELDAALRVQAQRRNRKVDPWASSWGGEGGQPQRRAGKM
jgi:hypothetical protein